MNIATRSIRALKWSYMGTAARVVLQFVVQIAFARLLDPVAFGSFATALLVIGFVTLVIEAGIGSSLIQRNQLTDADIGFGLTFSVFSATLASAALWIASARIATFFGNAQVQHVIQGMVPALFLQAVIAVPLTVLRRKLEMRFLQLTQVAAYLVGFGVVGIFSAANGYGIWSLVIAWNVQTIIAFLATIIRTRSMFRWSLSTRENGILSYGLHVLRSNLANWLIENMDNLVVARTFGPHSMGLYSVGYNFVRTPTNHLVNSLQQVLLPATAEVIRNGQSMGRPYLVILSAVALISFPLFGLVAAASEEIVFTLYGARWAGAAELLVPLSLSMPFHAIMAVGGPVLLGAGNAKADATIQTSVAVIFLVVLVVTAHISIGAVAWGVLGVYILRAAWISTVAANRESVPLHQVLQTVKGGLVLAAVGSCCASITSLLLSDSLSPLARLALMSAVGVSAVIITLRGFTAYLLGPALTSAVRRIFPTLSDR